MDNQFSFDQDYFWKLFSKKMAREATTEELAEFESLLMQSPELQFQVEMVSKMLQQRHEESALWTDAAYMRHLMDYKEDFFPEHNEDKSGAFFSEKTNKISFFRKFIRNKITIAFTGCLIIIFASWKIFFQKSGSEEALLANAVSSVTTKHGNRTKVILPDGSHVWLNAGSKLDYNPSLFNQDSREVSLSGEAFFEVVKDSKRPFFVQTENMHVKVLGTSFNLKSYPGENRSEASLILGSLEVTIPGRPQEIYILNPSEKLVLSNTVANVQKSRTRDVLEKPEIKDPETIISIKKVNYLPEKNIILETAWVNNRLEFRSEPFQDVAKKMERWYDVSIVFTSNKMADKILTGSFENETIEQALEALKIAESFHYSIEGKKIIIKP